MDEKPDSHEDEEERSALSDVLDDDRPVVEMPDVPEWEYERPEATLPEKKPNRGAQAAAASRGMGLALAIGTSFVGPILAGVGIGYLIDGHLGGIAGVIGLFAGSAIALFLLVRLVGKLNA